MSSTAHILAEMALGVLLAASSHAETPQVVRIEIHNRGRGPLDEGFVRLHLESRPGAPFERTAVTRDIKNLLSTERFSRVEVTATSTHDGLVLTYGIENRLILAQPPEIVGAHRFSPSRIQEWLGVKPGDRVDDAILGTAAQKVLQEYRDAHYPDATLQWTLKPENPHTDACRVTVEIAEGARRYLREVRFSGNRAVDTATLRRLAGQRAAWNPIKWLARWDWFPWWKRPYHSEEFEAAQLAIRERYLEQGFWDVQVSSPRLTTAPDGTFTVHFDIHEGPAYRIRAIRLGGVKLFPEFEFIGPRGVIRLRQDDPATLSAIREATEAIRQYYTMRGYLDTQVRYALHRDPASGCVDVHFNVKEGTLTHIGAIRIRGNTRTHDTVIRREIDAAGVFPGMTYDENRIRASERRLLNLGYFQTVRAFPADGEMAELRDLLYQVEEQPTGQLMAGVSLSSVEEFMATVEIAQRNFDITGWPTFTGGGQKARLSLQHGRIRRRYELGFVEPWLFNRQLLLGADLYQSEADYDDYDISQIGGTIRLARALPADSRGELAYRLERLRTRDVADPHPYTVLETGEPYSFVQDDSFLQSSLRLVLSRDTRNSPFFPSDGTLAVFSVGLMGGVLSGDTELYELGIQLSRFVPLWWNHVLSVLIRADVVDTYGQTKQVPIPNRLYAGGARTVRGFRFRDVGPKAIRADETSREIHHRPIGGQTRALGTIEYSLPIHPEARMIRLAAFHDLGHVWRTPYTFDFSEYAQSAGIGLRFELPQFPLRFDYAWPLRKDNPYTDTERFTFSIAYGGF